MRAAFKGAWLATVLGTRAHLVILACGASAGVVVFAVLDGLARKTAMSLAGRTLPLIGNGAGPRSTALPSVTQAHLHVNFLDPSEETSSGRGEELMNQLTAPWNDRDYKTARRILTAALKAGLGKYDESTAHCMFGIIYAELEYDLERCVDEFLACLAVSRRPTDWSWQAAKRLSYIYAAARRIEEAQMLQVLADHANRANGFPLANTPDVEGQYRALVG